MTRSRNFKFAAIVVLAAALIIAAFVRVALVNQYVTQTLVSLTLKAHGSPTTVLTQESPAKTRTVSPYESTAPRSYPPDNSLTPTPHPK